jgi:hypothetical protein
VFEGNLEKFKNPIKQRGGSFLRDTGLLMNSLSDLRLLHPLSFPLISALELICSECRDFFGGAFSQDMLIHGQVS